ncbi:response regulator transcription factor [Arcobacter sp. CECT 8985]|uniref:response regulator transcription factor n=1 Tax=Arcobacter sp. CECT 8985 TaxID=1935424 RepID=UPI00100BB243|nr:response regulator transcription factor [Arcobacter sp. CECT 8985]RXJ87205.1 DNA-binding response regulator [Arcobacter sp. CECT 8985]
MSKLFKNISILYVEDDEKIKENTSKILNLLFSKTYFSSNGKEALEIFKKYKPNIILTDYIMPYLNGYELITEVRKICEKTPIVIMSNFTDKDKLLKCIPLNLTQYLEKPTNYEELLSTLILCKEQLIKNNLLTFKLHNDIEYNFKTKKLTIQKENILLTNVEIEILEYFINRKNELISKEEISLIINNEDFWNDTSIKNIIYRLRKKIGKDLIKTHRNIGYEMEITT